MDRPAARAKYSRRFCSMDDQTDVSSYFLPNLTQIGAVALPFPSFKVPTRTYLMDNENVRQEVRASLYSPSPELTKRIGTLLESTDVAFLCVQYNVLIHLQTHL